MACHPYVRGVTEPLTRILRKNGILFSLDLTRPCNRSHKVRPPIELQANVEYKIPCTNCSWNYIGETGRCFLTRKQEHIRNDKRFKAGSNITAHAWRYNHYIDFQNAKVIDKRMFCIRKTLDLGITLILMKRTITPSHCLNNIPFF